MICFTSPVLLIWYVEDLQPTLLFHRFHFGSTKYEHNIDITLQLKCLISPTTKKTIV